MTKTLFKRRPRACAAPFPPGFGAEGLTCCEERGHDGPHRGEHDHLRGSWQIKADGGLHIWMLNT